MGAVVVTIEVLTPPGKRIRAEQVDVLADTGATLSIIPERILRRLGVKQLEKIRTRLTDGRLARRQVGETRLRINGRIVTSRVIFGKARDATVLGLVALESLGLTVDPLTKRLIPGEFLML